MVGESTNVCVIMDYAFSVISEVEQITAGMVISAYLEVAAAIMDSKILASDDKSEWPVETFILHAYDTSKELFNISLAV
jgi:hypothetical protein